MEDINYEQKFWSTPELVESLFPFLDALSIATLAKVHKLTARILQDQTSAWKVLVKRCCPFFEHRPENEYVGYFWVGWVDHQFEEKRADVRDLTRILKEMSDPTVPLLELLHVICERFPPVLDDNYLSSMSLGSVEFVQLRCPCQRSPHQVSQLGFLLLEEVEGALGSTKQKVEKVDIADIHDTWIKALNSRVSRQGAVVKNVKVGSFYFETAEMLEELLDYMKNCKFVINLDKIICSPSYDDNIGEEGWATMARILPSLNVRVRSLRAPDEDLEDAPDFRAIWEALGNTATGGMLHIVVKNPFLPEDDHMITWKTEEEKEKQWKRVTEILDLGEKQKNYS